MVIERDEDLKIGEMYYVVNHVEDTFAIVRHIGILNNRQYPEFLGKNPHLNGFPIFKILYGKIKDEKDNFLNKSILCLSTDEDKRITARINTIENRHELITDLFNHFEVR